LEGVKQNNKQDATRNLEIAVFLLDSFQFHQKFQGLAVVIVSLNKAA
jgi:hypothetical protein